MTALLTLPVCLSLLLLAAHASRAGWPLPLAAAILVLGLLLAVPRRWAARVLQVVLVVGSLEWLRTTVVLAMVRQEAGLPATRMVIILVLVAALTGASALVFRHARLRRRFR